MSSEDDTASDHKGKKVATTPATRRFSTRHDSHLGDDNATVAEFGTQAELDDYLLRVSDGLIKPHPEGR